MAFDVELIVITDVILIYAPPSASMRTFREDMTDIHKFNLGLYLTQSEPTTTEITVGAINDIAISNMQIAKDGMNGSYGSSIMLVASDNLANIWLSFDTADITMNATVTINFTTMGGPGD